MRQGVVEPVAALAVRQRGLAPPSWAPGRPWLAVPSHGGLVLVDADDVRFRVLSEHGPIEQVAWSPTEDVRAIGGGDHGFHGIRVVGMGDGELRWANELGGERADAGVFSPDGRRIVCLTDHLAVLDAATGA